jgi:hypothetical protein
MVPPDTAFFVNLPDTISSFDDLQLQVNAPNPDSSETSEICLDQHGFDYGYCHYTTDSLIDTENFPTLDGEMNHTIYLYRYKYHPNEHLPAVGGSITYRYIVERTFFTP